MRILFVGDVVGRPGRQILKEAFKSLDLRNRFDFIVVNAENSAGGFGITNKVLEELLDLNVDCLTMGNHTFDKREGEEVLLNDKVVRPLNLPPGVVGSGCGIFKVGSKHIAVINLLGRVFMPPIDCPFRAFDSVYELIKDSCDAIIVDFHAEATSEKVAIGHYLDGRATLVVGTHTHVPTADLKILPQGSAYITDVGMTGSTAGVIGFKKEAIISKFLTSMPKKFDVDSDCLQMQAVSVEVADDGRATSIESIFYPEHIGLTGVNG